MNYERNKGYFYPTVGGTLSGIGVIGGIIAIVVGAVIWLQAKLSAGVAGMYDPDMAEFLGNSEDVAYLKYQGTMGPMGTTIMIVGLAVMVVCIVFVVIKAKRMSSDTELDIQVQDEVNQLNKRAFGKHGVTEEQAQEASPLVFGGYLLDEKIVAKLFASKFSSQGLGTAVGTTGTSVVTPAIAMGSVMSASAIAGSDFSSIKYRKGVKDGIVRSTVAEYTVFHFSGDKVLVYTQQFSLTSPETKESAKGYSYRDIVSISSETTKYGAHNITVKMSGGNTLIIPCCNAKADSIKESVTAFMQLVRNKKNL